jgi:transcriptional regulator with XRE-family HTH domain
MHKLQVIPQRLARNDIPWSTIVCMPSTETPRQVELGRFMLELRKRAGRTQEQVAAHVNERMPRDGVRRAHTHVSRWERGRLPIEENELTIVLAYLEATSEETVSALRLHRDAADPDQMIPGIGKPLALMREYEDRAAHITNAQAALIPGPLQTRECALEVTSASGRFTERQVSDGIEFRMARRASLLSGHAHYEAIISEYALRYSACSREVAIPQLWDLAEVSTLPHVTIRVLPLEPGYHPLRNGSFVLFESDKYRPVVHLEQFRSSTTLTNSRDVRDYQDAAEALRRASMDPAASTEFIEVLANRLESTT